MGFCKPEAPDTIGQSRSRTGSQALDETAEALEQLADALEQTAAHFEAAEKGELKEMFGSGTATVINPIVGFGYKDQKFELPKIDDSYAIFFKDKLMKIQYNEAEDKHGWTYEVK